MIRILQFANLINRHDFIDVIVRRANPSRFQVGVCVRSEHSNIGDPAYDLRTPHWVIKGESRASIPYTAWRLACLLRTWRADILHTHHYDQAIIGWLATRIYPATRLVIGRHYSDAIYRLPRGLKRRGLLKLEELSNFAARRIIVPSSYIVDILTKRQGIRPERIDLVHYGFEPGKYALPAPAEVRRVREEYLMDGRFSVATFSRLHEEKGHRYLLEAAATLKDRMPNLFLLFVGDGPERSAIERLIQERQLHNMVRLLGHRRDAMTVMAAADLVVQPTLQEAFSQVMAEAMWMGKPLVITDVSGALDIIRHGENGLMVPRANADALAGAIERLASDAALRERLAIEGRTFAEEHLSIDLIISRYEECYLRAMES